MHAAASRHAAGVGLHAAGEDAQQRRLAVAVAADDADPVALVDADRDRLEDGLGREVERDRTRRRGDVPPQKSRRRSAASRPRAAAAGTSAVEGQRERTQRAGERRRPRRRTARQAASARAPSRASSAPSTAFLPDAVSLTWTPRRSAGSGSRSTRPLPHEPVDAVGHGAARHQRLVHELAGRELIGLAGAAQRRQHVELRRLEVVIGEGLLAGPVEVEREPGDAAEHVHGGDVHVRTLPLPRRDQSIDIVFHPAILVRQDS